MNSILLLSVILLTSTTICPINSISLFEQLLLNSNSFEGIDFVWVCSSNYSTSDLPNQLLLNNNINLSPNIGLWRNLSSMGKHETPLIVLITPSSAAGLVSSLESIGSLLAIENNSISESWDPLFFIEWPNQIIRPIGSNGESADNRKLTIMNSMKDFLTTSLSTEIRLDSDVFIILQDSAAAANSSSSSYFLFEIFYSYDNKLRLESIEHPQLPLLELYLRKAFRRQNFHGASLKAVGLADPDFSDQCKLEIVNGTVRFVSGLSVNFLHTLQYALNFSYEGVKGEGWIEQLENGTWLGMAKQLRNGEADLAISLSTHILYRFKGLGFLHPSATGWVNVFFRQPPASSIRDIFIVPFDLQVWSLLIVFWGLFVSCSFVTYWVSERFGESSARNKQVVYESLFWGFSVFCQKGWHICPSTTSLRIIFLSALFVGVIYYVAYCGSLVSTLSVDLVPIKSIRDLCQSELSILGDFWLPNNHAIVQSVEVERKKPRSSPMVSEAEQYIEINEAIPKLLTHSTAFITFPDGFLTALHRFNYTDRFYCDTFSSLGVIKAPLSSGMAVQKGSPLKEFMNTKILMIREYGIQKRFSQRYDLATSAQCPAKLSKLGQGLGISELFTVFALLCGGLVTSWSISVLEYIFFHFSFYNYLITNLLLHKRKL